MPNGWLSPTGELLICDTGKHALLVHEIMQIRNSDTETWVHVTPGSCYSDLPLTDAQIEWIKASGRGAYLKDLEMMLEMRNEEETDGD